MTRKYLAAFTSMAAVAFVGVVTGTGCKSTGVGDPCIPEAEYASDFLGFDIGEVNVESKSFQCQTRLCLVNHFRGRVSCPYGQAATADRADLGSSPSTFQCDGKHGAPDAQNTQCCIPGVDQPVISDADQGSAMPSKSEVQKNCADRNAHDAVYCSCRCANIDGKTDDGANYCSCPDGFECDQLVQPIGTANALLTGAYCVRKNTGYTPTSCQRDCDPNSKQGDPGYCGATNTANF